MKNISSNFYIFDWFCSVLFMPIIFEIKGIHQLCLRVLSLPHWRLKVWQLHLGSPDQVHMIKVPTATICILLTYDLFSLYITHSTGQNRFEMETLQAPREEIPKSFASFSPYRRLHNLSFNVISRAAVCLEQRRGDPSTEWVATVVQPTADRSAAGCRAKSTVLN